MFRQAVALVKQNVPIDVAFALDPHELMAWQITMGEIEGGEFDWGTMGWVQRAD